MPKLKLSYFDMHGGRGEAARMAFFIGGIDYEDDRIPFPEWKGRKGDMTFGTIPVLHVDDAVVSQCNGINRYAGKLAGLYPEDPLQAMCCDEAMDVVEDIAPKIVATFSIKDEEEKKKARQELADGPLTFYLRGAQSVLEARGGKYFADNRLTVGDLKVYLWVRHLRSGNLDHVPTDLVDRVAPKLVEHFERVKSNEKVKAYCEMRGIS